MGPPMTPNTALWRACGSLLLIGAVFAVDEPPSVFTAASATPTVVAGTTTKLAVVGTDDGGATALLYSWSSTGPVPVTFSATGTNAAKTVTATFKAPGEYVCTATITDAAAQTATSSVVVNVSQTLYSLAISPTSAVVNPGVVKQFTSVSKDQFGVAMTDRPLVWSLTTVSGLESLDQNGLFTAGATPGAATVTVVDGAKTAKATVRVNAAPTIALTPIATPVVGLTVPVSASAADPDDAVTTLKYTWTATGPKAVSFTPNGTNAAANAVAKFAAVGDYQVTVTVKDAAGLGASLSQAVSVQAVTTSVAVSPNATTTVVNPATTRAFTASVKDQFGAAITGIPVAWSVTPETAGTISTVGLFTGGVPSQASVTATANSVLGTVPVRVNAAPTIALPALEPVAGTQATFTAVGGDVDDAATTLKYYWSASGPKTVTFSPNGTNASATTTATFAAAGTYAITVIAKDPAGLGASIKQTVQVINVGTTATVAPIAATVLSRATKTLSVKAINQFGATYVPTITAATAVGGTVTSAGGMATFVAGDGTEPGSVSLTVDTVPVETVTVPVTFVPCAGTGTGLVATYFENEDFTGAAVSQIDPIIKFGSTQWPNAVPISGMDREWWSAIWVGSIDIPLADTYTFSTYSDDGVILMIDGNPIIENWTGHASTLDQATIALTAGKHQIQIRYYNSHGGANLDLLWSSAAIPQDYVPQVVLYPDSIAQSIGTGAGLCATYFDEDNFGGFTSTQIDSQLNMSWDSQTAPATSISPDAWSVRWVGQIEAPYTDFYTFSAATNHPFSLTINAQSVIADQTDGIDHTAAGGIYLQAGRRYDLVATYRSTTSPSRLALNWSCALTGATSAVPTAQFYPVNESQAVAIQTTSAITSYTNPAWIEGTVGHWTSDVYAAVNGHAVTVVRSGAAPWYLMDGGAGRPLGVLLNEGANTLAIDAVNGGVVNRETRSLVWTTLDLAKLPYGMDSIDVRPGDSLLLTATGNGSSLVLQDTQSGVNLNGTPGQSLPMSFTAGVHQVVAAIDGMEIGRLTVRVPSVNLNAPIACHLNYQRIKDISVNDNGASVVLVANDPKLISVGTMSFAEAERRVSIRPLQSGVLAIQARLGQNGPVIAQCPVDEFSLRTTAEKSITLVGGTSDGKQILSAHLIMSPLVKNIDVKLSVYTSGITFADSSLEQWINTNEFLEAQGDGAIEYRIIRSQNAATCHNIDSYQASVQISDR